MTTASGLRERIAALLHDPAEGHLDVTLARSILGTDDVETIASRVERYVAEELGQQISRACLFTQSVGAVFVLDLAGGERVVLKGHALGAGGARLRGFASLEELRAVYEAQRELAARGVPCARVLRDPRPWPGGAVAAMSFLEEHPPHDPHAPLVRRALAEGLAGFTRTASSLAPIEELPRAALPSGSVLPEPHNALFALDAPGGEWIDERARRARAVLDEEPDRAAVMHTDWSSANVRVAGGRVVAVYDMDSVAVSDEVRCVASAAVHFTYSGVAPWVWPSRDEASAFVRDYVDARGRPLDERERRRLDAAAIYAIAYTARCEQSDPRAPDGPMRRALREAPDAYFA